MAQEFVVEKVSQQEPRVYEGDYGKTYYIKTILKGHEKPVEIGKKDPRALKTGDTVFGDIVEKDFDTDSFKHAKRTQGGFQPRPDHHEEIKAQWAIGQAVQMAAHTQLWAEDEIENMAKTFYAMVGRVKQGVPTQADSMVKKPLNDEEFQKALGKKLAEAEADDNINLDDIPF